MLKKKIIKKSIVLKITTSAHDANEAYWNSALSCASFQGRLGINLFSYFFEFICQCLWYNKIFMAWPHSSKPTCLCAQGFVKCTLSLLTQQTVFPVVTFCCWSEIRFPVQMQWNNICTCLWRSFLSFCPKCFLLARLKKFLRKNQMFKRYVAPSPSVGMSTVNSTTLWNSLELVGNLQTQITCSWETTWTEAITRWKL